MRHKRIIEDIIARSQSLSSYDVGETIEGLASKIGRGTHEILKLNSNENFFVPLEFIREVLRQVIEETDPRIYPRGEFRQLKEAIGGYCNVSPRNIVVGAGSDQLIDLVSRIFIKEGDEALSIEPTFVIYERCIRIQGADYRSVPLKEDFSLDAEAMFSSITPKTKVVFICSPNNPTANQIKSEDILKLAEDFEGIVAVDEAYADFAGATLVDRACELENLIVFRTFSKVFGLAGLRLGYAVMNRKLAEMTNDKFQMPYSATVTALKAAIKMLNKTEDVRRMVDVLKAERSRLIDALNGIRGVRAFPSETNFVLFQVNMDSSLVYRGLLNRGVIVREIGKILKFNNCLRVTVAPSHIMERFINELKEVVSGYA